MCRSPWRPEEDPGSPGGAGVTGGLMAVPSGCWDLNLVPLQEQEVFGTADSSPTPTLLTQSLQSPPVPVRSAHSRRCTQASLPSHPLPLHFYRNHHPPISRLAGSNNLLISLPVFWVSPFQSILPAVTRPSILKPSLHHVRFLWKTTPPCWAL